MNKKAWMWLAVILGVFAVILLVRVHSQGIPTAALSPPPIHTPYPIPTTSSAEVPVLPAVVEMEACRLDKVATIYEVESAERQRIEVGGHGIQHVDYYPDRGVKAVSYIVPAIAPPEVPAIWWGFGSIWEGQLPECQDFDWEADATGYASARLDSGHSGVVVDLRSGTPEVVANVADLSQDEVDTLLAVHRQGQQGVLGESTVAKAAAVTVGCPPAEDHTYSNPADVTVSGPAIVHPWWNNGFPSFGQAQVRVMLNSGESATFLQMMGKTYVYQDTEPCRASLATEFENANFPIKTISMLESKSLVR